MLTKIIRQFKTKKYFTIASLVLVVFFIYAIFFAGSKGSESTIWQKPIFGQFIVSVTTKGQLEAKNSVTIRGELQGLQYFQIYQVTVQRIIDEGTIVKKGDWIATLDRSEFLTKFSQVQLEIETANSKYIQAKLDTSYELRQGRNELLNLKYELEEKELTLDQSKFEPPATIKQAEISLDKVKRAYAQSVENYQIQKFRSAQKIRSAERELQRIKAQFELMNKGLSAFDVYAPSDGMVIYSKGWDGKPIRAGSQINLLDPTVAILPDLSKMVSKTYVNEVDISKVQIGQSAEVRFDAYPDLLIEGKVIRVANIGEQFQNSTSKLFEVTIELARVNERLRPSMTTSCTIITKLIPQAISVPIESVHYQGDSLTYAVVAYNSTYVRKEITIGDFNSTHVLVSSGLNSDDNVLISIPQNIEKLKLVPINHVQD